MDALDSLSPKGVETAEKVAAQAAKGGTALLDLPQGKAAERAANKALGGKSAGDENNLLKPKRFSVLGTVAGVANIIPLVIWIGGGMVTSMSKWGWVGKIPGVGKFMGTAGKFTALNNVPMSHLGPQATQAFAHAQNAHPSMKPTLAASETALRKVHGNVAGYAQKALSGSKFGSLTLKRLSESSVNNALIPASIVIGESVNITLTTRMRLRVLRQMQADLTGKPAPSTFSILFGKHLHPMVMQARHELMGKKAGLATMLQVGGMVGSVWSMLFSRGKWLMAKQMGFMMGPSMVSNMITSSDTALASYEKLNHSFAQMGQADVETYAGVIGGFAKKASNEMIEKFAKQCYDEHVRPPELLRRIEVFEKSQSAKIVDSRGKELPAAVGINTAKEKARRVVKAESQRDVMNPA